MTEYPFGRMLGSRIKKIARVCAYLVCLVDLTTSGTLLAATIPPLPPLMVLDEPGVLTPAQRKVLETLLIEHADATGERILVGVFKGLEGADPVQRTHEVFEDWLGSRGQDKSALLAVYIQEARAHLESGYGLQTLDEKASHAAIHDDLLPELKAGHPFRALSLSLLDLLTADASPLIDSGRAAQLIQEGGIENPRSTATHGAGAGSWFAFVLIGALIFAGVFNNLLSAEAHFTGEGWYRPNPWKLLSLSSLRRATQPGSTGVGGADGRW